MLTELRRQGLINVVLEKWKGRKRISHTSHRVDTNIVTKFPKKEVTQNKFIFHNVYQADQLNAAFFDPFQITGYNNQKI